LNLFPLRRLRLLRHYRRQPNHRLIPHPSPRQRVQNVSYLGWRAAFAAMAAVALIQLISVAGFR
jgi:hypothetical protein